MNTLRFERLARAIEQVAQKMDDAIPLEQRGQAGNDYTFGIIKGYREAARIVREHIPTAIYSHSGQRGPYPGWYTSVGRVVDVEPATSCEWWCCREDDTDNMQGFAATEDEAEEAMQLAMLGKDCR